LPSPRRRLDETGQLQREERVPARALVDAEEGLAAERSAEAVEQQPLERTDAERLDLKVLETLCGERVLELRRPYALGRAAGEQDDDGLRHDPPQREHQGVHRRGVEPLHVVDGEEQRALVGEQLERLADSDGEGAPVDRIARRVLEQQRDLERPLPRRRQRRQHVVENSLEEIAQTGIGKAALRLGGA
jgi:hypothetical protein